MISVFDQRVAVVAALLGDEWRRERQSTESIARAIVEALDQRALVTKWEGERDDSNLFYLAIDCWVPPSDLLTYLNTLPGAPLTMADLNLKLQEYRSTGGKGDPEVQADCVRVFKREQRAGTEFRAILSAIHDEVIMPPWREEKAKATAAHLKSLKELAESGKDFGRFTRIDPESPDHYLRHAGQLFRIRRAALKEFALFRVDKVGDEGTPTGTFRSPGAASVAIKTGALPAE